MKCHVSWTSELFISRMTAAGILREPIMYQFKCPYEVNTKFCKILLDIDISEN